MSALVLPVLCALFVWWFATGAVLWLDGQGPGARRWSHAVSGAVALAALAWAGQASADATPRGAYHGFAAALLIWGWLELSFLGGFITGPRKQGCEPGCSEGQRFVQAVMAILYHELALLAAFGLLLVLTAGKANPVAAATFAVLWVMRLSAKLNLFLGVRNRGEAFLPRHLAYLQDYFRRRRMNALLPVSLLASGAAALALGHRLADATPGGFEATGLALVTTLLVLGIAEHLFMVLPLPTTLLWRWGIGKGHVGVRGS